MKLGFYYHVPVYIVGNQIKVPSYLGVFIKALSDNVDTLYLFMHVLVQDNENYCDYILNQKKIILIPLGFKKPAWHRFLFPYISLKKIENEVKNCDYLIVRAPSPLAPAFYKYFKTKTKIVYLVVGDYVKGVKYINQSWLRKFAIKWLSYRNDYQLSKVLKKTITLVNSSELYNKYTKKVKNLYEVKTTTISEIDFFFREDTCPTHTINLLYTGRFDIAKGLMEMIDATAMLVKKNYDIYLNMVGWEDNVEKLIEKLIIEKAKQYHIENRVIFHGKKSVGDELNTFYRSADIYVIPSYHEGFPRTIWEAMANSTPVIATQVGSIPYYLNDNENVLLIPPKQVAEIVKAIELLISNSDLRKKIIKNAFELVKENTLEFQTQKIIHLIKNNTYE